MRIFPVRCGIAELLVVLQARRLMAYQTHSVHDKTKAPAELTLPLCPDTRFVNCSSGPPGNNSDTRLILNEANFLEKILH